MAEIPKLPFEIDPDTKARAQLIIDDAVEKIAQLYAEWFVSYLINIQFLAHTSWREVNHNQKSDTMYTIKNVTTVTNEENGEVEHNVEVTVKKLSAADVTKMQRPLIAVQTAWNEVGIEGDEK